MCFNKLPHPRALPLGLWPYPKPRYSYPYVAFEACARFRPNWMIHLSCRANFVFQEAPPPPGLPPWDSGPIPNPAILTPMRPLGSVQDFVQIGRFSCPVEPILCLKKHPHPRGFTPGAVSLQKSPLWPDPHPKVPTCKHWRRSTQNCEFV